LPKPHRKSRAPLHVVVVVESANLTSRLGGWFKQRDFAWMDVAIAALNVLIPSGLLS